MVIFRLSDGPTQTSALRKQDRACVLKLTALRRGLYLFSKY